MQLRVFSLLMICTALCLGASSAEPSNLDRTEVYVVPFSHLDLFWACTQEECLSRGDFIISKAIQLAKQYPQYRYLLETEVFVSHFVDSHRGTQELEDFKQLVKEGRIEIAPLWAAIYQNQTRGEALVRNVVYGERYARDVFGVSPEVAHLADIPGFTRQYPQILTKAAIPYMVMTRMGPRDLSLFNWRAPDGSAVLVWNTINGYGWGVGLGLHLDLDNDHLQAIAHDLKSVEATTNGPIYMGWGTDLFAPNAKLVENIAVLNQHFSPTHFRLATAEEFFRSAAVTRGIPELPGEIPFSWANLTTSLVPLWLPAMSATDTLLSAEKFAAINYALHYAPYPDATLEALWKANLQSLDHNNDGQGGRIGDERKLGYAQQASREPARSCAIRCATSPSECKGRLHEARPSSFSTLSVGREMTSWKHTLHCLVKSKRRTSMTTRTECGCWMRREHPSHSRSSNIPMEARDRWNSRSLPAECPLWDTKRTTSFPPRRPTSFPMHAS